MHASALHIGKKFFDLYTRGDEELLDVGSRDVNGSLRSVCPPGIDYTGYDIEPGPGVDVVAPRWSTGRFPFMDSSFDLIVSTSCLEHDPLFWQSFTEMLRVVKPNGLIYLSVPVAGAYHAFPLDCWRFYPDAGLALQASSERVGRRMPLIESFVGPRDPEGWRDGVFIFGPEHNSHYLADIIVGATHIRRPLLSPQMERAFPDL